jgi:hypothetical protein
MPFVLQALLSRYGYRTTLRAVAVALTLLTGPLIPLLKGRVPSSRYSPLELDILPLSSLLDIFYLQLTTRIRILLSFSVSTFLCLFHRTQQ